MNKTALFLSISALVVGGFLLSSEKAYAYKGDPAVKGPNYSEERHEAMEKAFESNDYNSWKTLMDGRGRVTQLINEQNFARFAEAHRLAEEGNFSEAKQIREELGLGLGNKRGAGQGTGCSRLGQ